MTRAQYTKHVVELFGEEFENQNRFKVGDVTIDSIGINLTVDDYTIQIYSSGILTKCLDKNSEEAKVKEFIEGFYKTTNLKVERDAVTNTYVAFYPTSKQLPTDKEEILTMIESFISLHTELSIEKKSISSKRSKKYNFNSKEQNVAQSVAKTIKFGMDNKLSILFSRGASLFDMVDSDITIGKSNARTEDNSYREHIVPCDYIIEEAIKMYEEGLSIEEVAVMINQNLFIVLISKEEAMKLDYELGLKTTMPEGWKFGDSVFARLDVANIGYKSYE